MPFLPSPHQLVLDAQHPPTRHLHPKILHPCRCLATRGRSGGVVSLLQGAPLQERRVLVLRQPLLLLSPLQLCQLQVQRLPREVPEPEQPLRQELDRVAGTAPADLRGAAAFFFYNGVCRR